MQIKIFIISMLTIFLTGCPSGILQSNYLHSIEAGYEVDGNFDPLSPSAEEIDKINDKLKQLLKEKGYEISYESTSYGLLPQTGHTTHFHFDINKLHYVSGYVSISKRKFLVQFIEYEDKDNLGTFMTSDEDKGQILKVSAFITDFARANYKGRSIEVTDYINPTNISNKSEEPINYPAGNLSAHFKR